MADDLPEELRQDEFATLRGVKPPMVTRWKQKGWLVMTADGKRVRVAESIARLDAHLDPGRGGDRSRPGALPADRAGHAGAGAVGGASRSDYVDSAAREKRAKAQLAELDLAERAKQVVPVDLATAAYAKRVAIAKAELQAMPRRFAADVQRDAAATERRMSDEVRALCARLAEPTVGQDLVVVPLGAVQRLRAALDALAAEPDAHARLLPAVAQSLASLEQGAV